MSGNDGGDMPVRLQRKRTKGYHLPPGTIYVGRGSKWGNPFPIDHVNDAEKVVALYKKWFLCGNLSLSRLDPMELQGKNLSCWCPLVDKDGHRVPCHADFLLDICNRSEELANTKGATKP